VLLTKRLAERPDGVVIVINERKDEAAVDMQLDFISNLKEVAEKSMFPGIFYLKREGIYCPPFWSIVRFNEDLHYDQEELTTFVEKLFNVLYRKYIRGLGA
jgi:hypothetical protein